MSQATERMIEWFAVRAGRVTYSMSYRNGPSSYDCSSAIYFAMIHAGLRPPGSWIGNTESLFRDLPGSGWYQLPSDPGTGFIDARRGDVFIWGRQGASIGAAGHTGSFVDPENIIHCNYGYNGITVNRHDAIWAANGYPTVAIFRYRGNASDAAIITPAEKPSIPAQPAPDPHNIVEYLMTMTRDEAIQLVAEGTSKSLRFEEGFLREKFAQVIKHDPGAKDALVGCAKEGAVAALSKKVQQYGIWNGVDLSSRPGNTTSVAREIAYQASENDKRKNENKRLAQQVAEIKQGQDEILALLKGGTR